MRHTQRIRLPNWSEALLQDPTTYRPGQDIALPSQVEMSYSQSLEIDASLWTLLAPYLIYVNSPDRLEAESLQPFLNRQREVLLVNYQSQNKVIVAATLGAMDDTSLVVERRDAPLSYGPQEQLLVIFPVYTHRHYALPVQVTGVTPDHMTLQYQEPRHEARHVVAIETPVTLRLAPPLVTMAITQKQVGLVRQLTQPGTKSHYPAGHLADILTEPGTTTPSSYMHTLTSTPAFACRVHDISPGGIGVSCEEPLLGEDVLHRLALLHITLPGSVRAHTSLCVLQPLGIIHGVNDVSQTLHVGFLKRLPDSYAVLLTVLEHETPPQPGQRFFNNGLGPIT